MNRICLEIRHDGTCMDFDGNVLAQVRGPATPGDPHSDVTGMPEVVLYRKADDEIVITYDSVAGPTRDEASRGLENDDKDPKTDEEVHRSVLFGEVVKAEELTDPWVVNTAINWDVPLQLMLEACNSSRVRGAPND